MTSIFDWSTTPANNATADTSINWQEGQAPSTVNNSARVMMERVKELLNDIGGVNVATGTASAITLSTSSPISSYSAGVRFIFKAIADNPGSATLNVNALGAKNLYSGSLSAPLALAGGEIRAGALIDVLYSTSLNSGVGGFLLLSSSVPLASSGDLSGLTLSNNASDAVNDIDIAAGYAADSAASPMLMQLATGITKRLDAAWAVGSGNGGLDTGSIANTTYHVWLIQRSDTGVVDVLFSTSATSPTMPTNYDRKRRIGSILRESAAIVAFTQFGDLFLRTSPATDRSALTAQSSVLLTLSVPVGIPVRPILQSTLGLSVAASWTNSIGTAAAGSANVAIQQLTISSGTAVDITTADFAVTNTSAQIYFSAVQNSGGSPSTNSLRTAGWYDTRGRV